MTKRQAAEKRAIGRAWKKLVRDSMRAVTALTRHEERAIEEEFWRRLARPMNFRFR